MRYVSLFAAGCVVLLMAQLALAEVVFSDSEFADPNWELTVLTDGPAPPWDDHGGPSLLGRKLWCLP